jgi:hypothetical protein
MATFVGKQDKFSDAIYELCELDIDAIGAYQTAIDHLDNSEYVKNLSSFKSDHERHVRELSELLVEHNLEAPKGSSAKSFLAKGKVYIADLFGDKSILEAMLSNEMDTNIAYGRLNNRPDEWEDAKEILRRGLEDERRHKLWLESILGKDASRKAA